MIAILLCGAVIGLALYSFLSNMINISKGKCCGGCSGCNQKNICPNGDDK